MDGTRFDGLTRALARGASRRTVLRGLIGGAAAGTAAAAMSRVTLADEHDEPVACPGLLEPCGEVEIAQQVPGECCDGLVCCEGDPAYCAECCSDAECPQGSICCAGACRELECCIDDILTGGDPNARCPEGTSCFEGFCDAYCSTDDECEDGTCCCPDGSCSADCCEGTGPGGPDISTLPNTGVGGGSENGRWFGAALATGAAAWLAARQLGRTSERD